MLNIEGKQFTINLDNLFNYIIRPSKQDKREQEITDGYDLSSGDGMKQVSKIIREVKSKGDTSQESCRYDFLRILLSQVLDIENSSEVAFGDELAIATLIKYNILEEI